MGIDCEGPEPGLAELSQGDGKKGFVEYRDQRLRHEISDRFEPCAKSSRE